MDQDGAESSSDSFASDDEGDLLASPQDISENGDDDQETEGDSENDSAASGDELFDEQETFEEGDHQSDDEVSSYSPSARSTANTMERESTADDGKSDVGLERTPSQKVSGGKTGKQLKKKGSKAYLVGKRKGEGKGDEKGDSKVCTRTIDFSLQVDVRKDPNRAKPTKDKALLYKLTSGGQYNCIRQAFKRAGFYATSGNHFNVMWGKPLKNPQFKELNPFQKVNHFPGMYLLGRKDNLARACNRFRRTYGPDAFPYLPKTFVLPADRAELLADWEAQKRVDPNQLYIVKPPASCKGIGIRLVSDPSTQIKEKTIAVVSRYISDPLLIDGTKFDLRIYVVITSFQPLRIFVHEQGMARFCTVKYSSKTRKNRYRHLTNYSLNKNNPDFVKNSSADSDDTGHKWSLRGVWQWLDAHGVDALGVQRRIDDLIVKTILAVEVQVHTLVQLHVPHRASCFQLLGFDVMLDSRLQPWLMEVNTGLSLATDSPLDKQLKNTVVSELLHMIQVTGYDRRKLGETQAKDKTRRLQGRDKRNPRSHADNVRRRDVCAGRVPALQDMTEEDGEVLWECEEELARKGGYRCLFPTKESAARGYCELFAARRFSNALLWEWVAREHPSLSVQDYIDGRHQAKPKPLPLRRANTGPQLGGALLQRTESWGGARKMSWGERGSAAGSPRGRGVLEGDGDRTSAASPHSPALPLSPASHRPALSPALSPVHFSYRTVASPEGGGAAAAAGWAGWGAGAERRRGQQEADGMRALLESMAAGLRGTPAARERERAARDRERERDGLFFTGRVRASLQLGARKPAPAPDVRRSVGEGADKALPPVRAIQQLQQHQQHQHQLLQQQHQHQHQHQLHLLSRHMRAASSPSLLRPPSPSASGAGLRRGMGGEGLPVPVDGAAG